MGWRARTGRATRTRARTPGSPSGARGPTRAIAGPGSRRTTQGTRARRPRSTCPHRRRSRGGGCSGARAAAASGRSVRTPRLRRRSSPGGQAAVPRRGRRSAPRRPPIPAVDAGVPTSSQARGRRLRPSIPTDLEHERDRVGKERTGLLDVDGIGLDVRPVPDVLRRQHVRVRGEFALLDDLLLPRR